MAKFSCIFICFYLDIGVGIGYNPVFDLGTVLIRTISPELDPGVGSSFF